MQIMEAIKRALFLSIAGSGLALLNLEASNHIAYIGAGIMLIGFIGYELQKEAL